MTRYIVLGATNSLILLTISGSAGFDIVQRCGSLTPCAGPGWGTWLMAGLPIILLVIGAVIFAPRAIRNLRAGRVEATGDMFQASEDVGAPADADDVGLSRLQRLRAAPNIEETAQFGAQLGDADHDSVTETWPVADVGEWEVDDEWTAAKAGDEILSAEMPVATDVVAEVVSDWAGDADSVDAADMADADDIAPGFAALGDWRGEAPEYDLPAEQSAERLEEEIAEDTAEDGGEGDAAMPFAPVLAADPFAAGRNNIVWATDEDGLGDEIAANDVPFDAQSIVPEMTDEVDCLMPPAIHDDGAFDDADCPPIAAFAPANPWSASIDGAPATGLSPLQQAAWLVAPGPLPRLRAHGETGFPWAAATISAVADSMLDLASPPSLGEFAAEVSAWKQVVAELPAATPITADDAAAFNAWLESLAQHLFLFGTPPDLETLLVDALSRVTWAAEGDGALAAILPAELFPTDARNVA